MNKLVDNSAFKWSAEDFDCRLAVAHQFDGVSVEAFNKLNALTNEEKLDIVSEAIEGIEDHIMELINEEIVEFIISLSEKYNQ